MLTVALVGPDGAGKTSIARRLPESLPIPVKRIYMGTAIQSSNVSLPTSRAILYFKLRASEKAAKRSRDPHAEPVPRYQVEHQYVKRGRLGSAARILNRMAEEWYRQIVSWIYQLRGYVVICDRHFVFEYSVLDSDEIGNREQAFGDRLHHWCLQHLYPRPDATIFLDAPADVLHRRKGEWTLENIRKQRDMLIERGKEVANFIRIDATQPLDDVVNDVARHILNLHQAQNARSTRN